MAQTRERARPAAAVAVGADPTWYKDAILYEVHVRAFADSNGDGVGDFRGLISKLDYLQSLGVTAIWLLPFYPSPLKDDGYDISAYKQIHPAYGTLRDFRLLMRAARRRGLRIITELVLNHTSDQHPWFQRARRAAPGTTWRDFYVWSDTPDRYRDARIIFKDFESSNWAWDPVAQAYYWHRFYSHQPDLNYDNPEVRKAMFQVVDFWLDMGVDGLRLDAVPYLFERDGTICENLPETLTFLEELRGHMDERYPGRMLLAEANQWPEDAAAYFGTGNRAHMAFHFPLMPRMFMSIRMEDRFPVVDILSQTPPIPEVTQWAIFLRNHDELTLEMVTDEERDYMYRVYAEDPQARINLGIRRRLAPLLGNNRRVIEMMNGLLMTLPGTPVIYYGDEIGMGDNIYLGDRNSVRTPMQWSADRNAGFSSANPQQLYLPVIIDPEYHSAALNVEAQQNNPHSLLWWMKRLIALRKRYRAFGRGTLEFLYPENRKVLAYIRRYENERILVVANLSRFAQWAELDLSEFRGTVPLEVFGGSDYPRVEDRPYLLTLGPYAFVCLALPPIPEARPDLDAGAPPLPVLEVAGDAWDEVLEERGRGAFEEILPGFLRTRRWYGAKARRIKTTELVEVVPVTGAVVSSPEEAVGYLAMAHVEFTEGDPATYLLPLAARQLDGEGLDQAGVPPQAVMARIRAADREWVLFDGMFEPLLTRALLEAVGRRRRLNGRAGQVIATPTQAFGRLHARDATHPSLEPSVLGAEQSNTSVMYGNRLLLKAFRRLEEGQNPDLEIGRFLTDRVQFQGVPQVAGSLEYRTGHGQPMTLAVFQQFVPNEGDAWRYTLDELGGYLDTVMTREPEAHEPPLLPHPLLDLASMEPPEEAHELFGTFLESARLLGRRTAELHLALAFDADDPTFAPEPFTALYQRSMYQSMRTLTRQVFQLARARASDIPQTVQILDLEQEILERFRTLLDVRIEAMRIRTHGDYHLGQVLFTGRDFVVIDFEGEPLRPLGERRIKRSPIRDVAGMIRSIHYAAYAGLFGQTERGVRPENPSFLEPWVLFWYQWVAAGFLRSYLDVMGQGQGSLQLLPRTHAELEGLLQSLLLEKAVYELQYEMNHRPDWVRVPIGGILQLLEHGG